MFQNNPKRKGGQQGPRERTLHGPNYPLDDREQELRDEINSPTIPTIYKRVPTIDQTEAPQRGSVGESSHEAYAEKQGHFAGVEKANDTWDSVAPMTEDNMRMKFVKLGVESEDESVPANYSAPSY